MTQPGEWLRTGVRQEIPASRLTGMRDAMEAAYQYAIRSRTHLWVITLAHRATDQALDGFDGQGGSPILDADTLLTAPAIGCFVCEEPYTKQLRRRRCPGEPKGAR